MIVIYQCLFNKSGNVASCSSNVTLPPALQRTVTPWMPCRIGLSVHTEWLIPERKAKCLWTLRLEGLEKNNVMNFSLTDMQKSLEDISLHVPVLCHCQIRKMCAFQFVFPACHQCALLAAEPAIPSTPRLSPADRFLNLPSQIGFIL